MSFPIVTQEIYRLESLANKLGMAAFSNFGKGIVSNSINLGSDGLQDQTQKKRRKIEVEILKGQESFRVKSFVRSNIWALLPAGKSKFKKGEIVDCFFPNHINQSLI